MEITYNATNPNVLLSLDEWFCDFLFLLSIVTWKQVIIETFSSLKYAGSSDNQHNYQLIVLNSWTRNTEQDRARNEV